jgi:hypothetical protein
MRAVDWVVHYWAKTSMLLMTYRPKIVGMEHLPPKGEPVSVSSVYYCTTACIAHLAAKLSACKCATHTYTAIVFVNFLQAALLTSE